jgi:hypothetical protein
MKKIFNHVFILIFIVVNSSYGVYAIPVDNSTDLSQYQGCEPGPDVCIDDNPQTRTIDGVSYTRPCWQYQQTWNCYTTQINDSCAAQDMTGWYPIGDAVVNPVYFNQNTQSFMTSWQTMYGNDQQSCTGVDTSAGCGDPFNILANVNNNITQNYSYQKICLLPPDQQPAGCTPPQADCTVANTLCLQSEGGVCIEEELTYQCGSGNPDCVGYASGVTLSDTTADNGFNAAVGNIAMAEVIANYSTVDADGNLIIFNGKEQVCHYMTDSFITRVTVSATVMTIVLTIFTAGGYAAAAGAVTAYGISMLSTMKCCQSDPGMVITTNDFCTENDIELAAARLKNRATRIDVNPNNLGYASTSEHNCYCEWPLQYTQIQKTNITDCRMSCIGGEVIAVNSETWCHYPNIINKIVQEQGRQQLASMAVSNVAGATTTTFTYPYYIPGDVGQWTTPITANGHQVAFWQWPEMCRTAGQQAEQVMSSACPVNLNTTWMAECQRSAVECAAPNTNSNPGTGSAGVDWTVFSFDVDKPMPIIPTESLVVDDQCDLATNNCNAQIHAWPVGGGQLHNTIPMHWSLRFHEPTGWSSYFGFDGPNGMTRVEPMTWETNDPAAPTPTIRYTLDGGATWNGPIVLSDPQPDMNYVINPGQIPELSVYGACDNMTCDYYAAYNTTVQAKSWGYYTWYEAQSCLEEVPMLDLFGGCLAGETWKERTCDSRTGCVQSGTYCGCIAPRAVTYNRQWHADCSGFSLEEMQLLDFGAMDFSEFTNSLVANPPSAQDLVNASLTDATTIQSTGQSQQLTPLNTNDWTFKLEPSDPYPGTLTTLRMKASYPIAGQYGQIEVANSYSIDWGDGTAIQYVNATPDEEETVVTHVYGGRANCAPTDTYCAPVPNVDTNYTIRVTFNTAAGGFTDTGIVRVSVTANGATNQNQSGQTTHGTTVVSPSQPLQ